jgi:dUTP pyrophosphatase
MTNKIQILVLRILGNEDIPLPSYASSGAAAVDLYAAIKKTLKLESNERTLIPTGIKLMLPDGYEGQIRPRSGIALKHGVTVLNSPGTIDPDYRGEIGVLLINHGNQPYQISRGDRIAQLIVAPLAQLDYKIVNSLPETGRGEHGFGSTGMNINIYEDQ